MPKSTFVALGDIHFPFHHQRALSWAIEFIRQTKPTYVVQVGDLRDLFAYSRFPKVIKMPVEEELEQGTLHAQKMWAAIHKASPKSKKFQLMGNHDDRILKTAVEKAPELVPIIGKSVRDLFTFDNVTTVHDSKEELYIEDICFMHGFRARLGDHARYNQGSTVCGHSHTGGVVFQRNRHRTYFELNAGLLGDPDASVFGYRAQRLNHTCTLGLGYIDVHGPRFIPYPG